MQSIEYRADLRLRGRELLLLPTNHHITFKVQVYIRSRVYAVTTVMCLKSKLSSLGKLVKLRQQRIFADCQRLLTLSSWPVSHLLRYLLSYDSFDPTSEDLFTQTVPATLLSRTPVPLASRQSHGSCIVQSSSTGPLGRPERLLYGLHNIGTHRRRGLRQEADSKL